MTLLVSKPSYFVQLSFHGTIGLPTRLIFSIGGPNSIELLLVTIWLGEALVFLLPAANFVALRKRLCCIFSSLVASRSIFGLLFRHGAILCRFLSSVSETYWRPRSNLEATKTSRKRCNSYSWLPPGSSRNIETTSLSSMLVLQSMRSSVISRLQRRCGLSLGRDWRFIPCCQIFHLIRVKRLVLVIFIFRFFVLFCLYFGVFSLLLALALINIFFLPFKKKKVGESY